MVRIRLLVHILSPLLVLMVFGCGGGGSPKLPPAGFKVEFTGHSLPTEMTVGQRLLADVSFKNVSARTWPSKPNHKGLNAVNLSYHWLDQKDRTVVFDGLRTSLPHDLSPGESAQLNAAIQAPDQPGRYMLHVTLVQEGVAWFPERDGDKIAVPVNVSEAKAAGSNVNRGQLATEVGSAGSPSKRTPHPDEASESVAAKKLSDKTRAQRNQRKPGSVQARKSRNDREQQTQPWSVQIGSYSVEKEAQALAKRLKNKGYDAYVAVAEIQGKSWYRVRVGHLASRGEAEKLQKSLREAEGLTRTILARPR